MAFEPHLRPARNEDTKAIVNLIFEVLDELGLEPDRTRLANAIKGFSETHLNKGGGFWVLESPGAGLIGTVALLRIDAQSVELQRMYLTPSARGQGWGRRLLEHALAAARHLRYQRVVLDTSEKMTTAVGLYRRHGFTPIERRDEWSHCDLAFELTLEQSSRPMETIATVSEPAQAQLIRSVLEGHGISAFIPDENTAEVAPHALFTTGVRVQVSEEFAATAREVLAKWETDSASE